VQAARWARSCQGDIELQQSSPGTPVKGHQPLIGKVVNCLDVVSGGDKGPFALFGFAQDVKDTLGIGSKGSSKGLVKTVRAHARKIGG
jgi:hypothetical protein